MKRQMTRNSLPLSVVLIATTITAAAVAGCDRSHPEIFDGANRAATEVMASTNVGVNYAKLGELVITLATESDLAKQKATKPAQLAVVADLEAAIEAYRDSLSVWKMKIEHGKWITKFDGIEPYATKYEAPSHPKNDSMWETDAVMRLAWSTGEEQLKNAQQKIAAMR